MDLWIVSMSNVHEAVMNMGVQIPLQYPVFVFSGYVPRSGISGYMAVIF